MQKRDIATGVFADLCAAFGLLTRLPLPFAAARPDGAWAWPVAGAVVGMVAAAVAALLSAFGLPPGPVAGSVLAIVVVLTGALHEDGLADAADGLFGGLCKERRLQIMKDSHIGSYGAVALMLGLLLRWSALTTVISTDHWGMIIAVAALSRAPMAAIMAGLVNARGAGLSHQVGRPSAAAAALAAGLALAIAVASAGWVALPMALAVGLAALGVAAVAQAKIGGQTGDILGAAQQTSEIAALCVAAALV